MNHIRTVLTGVFAIVSLAADFATGQSMKESDMTTSSVAATANGAVANRLIPAGYVNVSTRAVAVDGSRASLLRYEREDGRNHGLFGEHFSAVVADTGQLKGFTRMDIALAGGTLPSRERTREIALTFLRAAAPDLLPRMEVSWIEPHDESIQALRDGRFEKVTLTGMKLKARNLANGRWFWVIVSWNDKVMVFERDIVWITFPGHRKTEKWLHDQWLAERDGRRSSS